MDNEITIFVSPRREVTDWLKASWILCAEEEQTVRFTSAHLFTSYLHHQHHQMIPSTLHYMSGPRGQIGHKWHGVNLSRINK